MIFYYLTRGPLLLAMGLLSSILNILPPLEATVAAIANSSQLPLPRILAKANFWKRPLRGPFILGALG